MFWDPQTNNWFNYVLATIRNKPTKDFEEICEGSKRMEKTENINQAFRDENYELISANEGFQREILIRKNQLNKRFFTPFAIQRNPTFFDPEQFAGIRDELEFFKFNMKTKFQANGDWYFTEKKNFNYVFSRFKFFVQGQIFSKMNVLKIHTVEKLLQCLDVNFGDHNKKQTVMKQKKSFSKWQMWPIKNIVWSPVCNGN